MTTRQRRRSDDESGRDDVAVTELHRRPGTETGVGWWLWRPFWLVAPALVFLAAFRIIRALVPSGRSRGGVGPADDREVPAVPDGELVHGPGRGNDPSLTGAIGAGLRVSER